MNKKLEIEVDADILDTVILHELVDSYSGLAREYENRMNGEQKLGIFETDRTLDLQVIKYHLDAFQTVIDYYSPAGKRL